MTGLKTDLNVSPYFDDFVDSAEGKNYHRVLFKPSIAVQARELTTLQSILQNQIERFGDNILVEGTIVKGGNFIEVRNLKYVKILDINTNNQPVVMSQYMGRFAVGLVSGIKAKIMQVDVGLESQLPDLNTLYITYMTTSDTGQKVFIAGENLEIQDASGNTIDTLTVAGSETTPIGNSYGLKCGDGILYQRGHFINFNDHLVVVSKYTNIPTNVTAGFDIVEEIVNSYVDPSLLDNANGFSNDNAPGADRLKLTPQLVIKTIEDADETEGFLKIQEYQNGKVVRRRTDTQFNSVNKELKKRTKEESGNYSIGEVPVDVTQNTANTSLLNVVIGKGISYVEGQRVEYVENYTVTTPKPEDFQTEDNQNILTNVGHYVVLSGVTGVFNFVNMNAINLLDGSAAVVGKANLRAFGRHTATLARAYIFNIRMNSGKTFNDVRSIKQGTSEGTLVLESGKPVIKDFSFKPAFFTLGKDAIKTLPPADTSYVSRTATTTTVSGTALTLSLSAGEFPYGNGATLNSDQKNELYVVINGTVVDISATTVTTNADASALTITFGSSTYNGQTAVVSHDVKYENVVASKKTLSSVYIKVAANTNQGGTTGTYSLGLPDIFAIEGIWMGTGTYSESNADVTANFKLYPNQKDDFYGHSFVKKVGSLSIPSNATFLFKLSVFRKDAIASFFSVDSYPIDDTVSPLPNTIRTERIPNYTSENGTRFDLRNVIDFRPYVSNSAAYSATAGSATIVTLSVTNEAAAATFAAVDRKFCAPNRYTSSSYQYYIGRQDRVMITDDGTVEVIQGIPSERPTVPSEIDSGMTVATINIPPYPSLPFSVASRLGKTQYGITITKQKNRRYTMHDVGRIDERVSQLEYYTVLNALEKSADDMIITDSAGLDRFKNGIIVDSFTNLAIANTNHTDFSAGVDPAYEELTPKFRAYPIDLEIASIANATDHGEGVTLNYTRYPLVSQMQATKTRSCTSGFYKYTGSARIFPEYDASPDVSTAPDVNIDVDLGGVFADFTDALSDFVPLSTVSKDVVTSSKTDTNTTSGVRRGNVTVPGTTTTSTTTTSTTTTATTKKLVTNTTSSKKDVGDFVTDVNFGPYLRAKSVRVWVSGLRPNTQFYFWFDGKDVMEYIFPASGDTLKTLSRKNRTNVVKSDANGILKAIFKIPAETFKVGDRVLEMYDIAQYNSIGDATSSALVTYSGYNFSYETGSISVTTRAPKFDTATMTSTKKSTTSATTTTTVTNPIRERNSEGGGRDGGKDPISMTIFIDKDMTSDTDLFVDSIDLYFAKKGVNGVQIQLRETDNGYPGEFVLPFADVIIPPSQVNANETNGSVATNIVFDAPIALKADQQYCVVIIPVANDPDYRMWVAKTGEKDVISGKAITKDVSSGTLFTSTNSSAWTAYQDENLKYRLYGCRFNTAAGLLYLKPQDYEFFSVQNISGKFKGGEMVFAEKAFNSGTLSVVDGSRAIVGTGTTFSSTFAVGDYLVIKTTSTEFEPVRVSAIANNTSMTVSTAIENSNASASFFSTVVGEVDYFNARDPARLNLKNSSVRTGRVFATGNTLVGADTGATCVVSAIENQRISYLQPHIYRTNFSKTRTVMSYEVNGKSYAAEFNENKYLNATPHYIYSRSNEITGGLANSLAIRLSLQNTALAGERDTSPFIDYAISKMKVYEYLLDETTEANYVSKIVTLQDGLDAEDFKFFLTGYRPTGTDLEAYIRFLAGTDPTPMSETAWTKLAMKGENTFFSSNSDRFDFKEFEFNIPTVVKTAGNGAWKDSSDIINYIAEDGSAYNNFKFFEIKITMKADEFNRVPRVADMRGIALS